MTAQQMLFYLGIAFFVLTVLFVALAVWVFVAKDIPEVYADLTGKKRAREIQEAASGQRSSSKKKKSKNSAKKPSANSAENVVVSAFESGALRGETQTTRDLEPTQITRDIVPPTQEPSQSVVQSGQAPAQAASGYAYKVTSLEGANASDRGAASANQGYSDGSEETSLIGVDTEETSILAEVASDDSGQTTLLEEITEEVAEEGEPRHSGEMPAGFQITTKIVLMEATDFIAVDQGEKHA